MKRGFTLIELLIVIAIVLIFLAGNAKVARLQQRSATLARDLDRASALLASELAYLKAHGAPEGATSAPLRFLPAATGSSSLPGATGEIRLSPRPDLHVVEAEAVLTWRSVTGERSWSMGTLVRSSEPGAAP